MTKEQRLRCLDKAKLALSNAVSYLCDAGDNINESNGLFSGVQGNPFKEIIFKLKSEQMDLIEKSAKEIRNGRD